MMSAEREAELMRRWRDGGDLSARDQVLNAHIRMSVRAGARAGRYASTPEDIAQEANLGLLTAAANFDPERGFRFSTYAKWWVDAGVQQHVIEESAPVRTGSVKARRVLHFHHSRTRAAVERDLGHGASRHEVDAEIARRLGLTVAEVERASGGAARFQSLDAPIGEEDGATRADMIPDEGPGPADIVEAGMVEEARRRWIARAMDALLPRERAIVEARKYCDDAEEQTLETLADRFGISRERVRQIEATALGKLRKALASTRRAADLVDA